MTKAIYVGLVSDSHGRFTNVERMLEQAPDVAAWVHCGDYYTDGDDLAIASGVPVYAVMGNNDYYSEANGPECRFVTIGGVHIVAIHGHQWYGAQRLQKLAALGQTNDASLVVFGHTHRRLVETVDGITIVNPGSISLPRDGRRGTYGIASIEDGMLANVQLYEVQ